MLLSRTLFRHWDAAHKGMVFQEASVHQCKCGSLDSQNSEELQSQVPEAAHHQAEKFMYIKNTREQITHHKNFHIFVDKL